MFKITEWCIIYVSDTSLSKVQSETGYIWLFKLIEHSLPNYHKIYIKGNSYKLYDNQGCRIYYHRSGWLFLVRLRGK